MTREMFKELFGLNDYDSGMEYADERHEEGMSWLEIAKADISTMNYLISNNKHDWSDKDDSVSRNSLWKKILRFATA